MNDSIATPATAPTIDTEELLARCLGRIELMERIIDRFVGSSQAEIDSLEFALQSNDSQEIARLAHKLSGTAITVSAKSLATAAKALEQQAIDQCAETLEPLVNNVTREFDSIRSRYSSAKTEATQ
jgi:HPt (histidine-containing phosphotransfer) domain-containing protein